MIFSKINQDRACRIYAKSFCDGAAATTALQNGACTYRCISKQMHYKTPFSHHGYMKSLEFYENYITLFCPEKKTFLTILYQLRTMNGILPKFVEITI
jgi:hypothetical protein